MALNALMHKPAIFLSASIPTPDRDERYRATADVIAIRDCIKALVAQLIPDFLLVWGGHPSITPMIRALAESHPEATVQNFLLYQSTTFRNVAPRDNDFFQQIVWVPGSSNVETSLHDLRTRMLREPRYVAGVFIGGMEGIENEFSHFRRLNPHVPVYPVASTGGAAQLIFREWSRAINLPSALNSELAYPYLWRQLLSDLRP